MTSGQQTGTGPGLLGGELECDALGSSGNHPLPLGLCKNCLPQNQSLVPIRLGTVVLAHGAASTGEISQ